MKAVNKPKLGRDSKRSVHVKWDSSIIDLGTFPDKEVARICKRVKDLTTIWRSISPKPSVEWVKLTLERNGIRVVKKRPDRQLTKNDSSPNQKGSVIGGEEISAAQQIQTSSLLSLTNPNQPIATEKMNPYTNWGINIAEGGIPSRSKVQVNSTVIVPTEPISNLILSPPRSNGIIASIRSQQGNCDIPPVAAKGTKLMETHRVERDQVEGRLAYPDLEALDDEDDDERRYRMLKRHKLHLKAEMEEVKMLMSLKRDEYN